MKFENVTFRDLRSPGYPYNYLEGTEQTWIAAAPPGEGMLLTVRDMDLGTGDVLMVGYKDTPTHVFKSEDAAGLANKTFSFGPKKILWVLFTSDSDGSVGRGFWLTLMRDESKWKKNVWRA